MKIYQGKKVFITGCTGFKGSWLAMMLLKMGAVVKGYSLEPEIDSNHFNMCNLSNYIDNEINDIRDYKSLKKSISDFRPDIIFHLAAQPLVRRSYREPYKTMQTNIIGTLNLLDICRNSNITKAIVNITTDKVYKIYPFHLPYSECDKLGGDDPYSASKSCSELITHAYRESFFTKDDVLIATARAGNCIGGGDFSEDRLIPDIMSAIRNNSIIILRNPDQIRPFQHVLDPLYGYLMLGEKLLQRKFEFVDSWNFAPEEKDCISVEKVLNNLQKQCKVRYDIQKDNSLKETQTLRLNSTKSKTLLKWVPRLDINASLKLTLDWYLQFYEENKIITPIQIDDYFSFVDFLNDML